MYEIQKVENGYIVRVFDYENLDEDGLPGLVQFVFVDVEQMMTRVRSLLEGLS